MVTVLQKTNNMINLRSGFEENSLETYEDLQRTCLTIILVIKPPFVDVFMTVAGFKIKSELLP